MTIKFVRRPPLTKRVVEGVELALRQARGWTPLPASYTRQERVALDAAQHWVEGHRARQAAIELGQGSGPLPENWSDEPL